jgi:23S rRNA (guanine745-N1)-methyltransferase
MHAHVIEQLRCPICETGFRPVEGGVICGAGHRFDFARQGYLNLLSHRSRSFR